MSKSIDKKRRRSRLKKLQFVNTVIQKQNKRGRPRKTEEIPKNFNCEGNSHTHEKKDTNRRNSSMAENAKDCHKELRCQNPEHPTSVEEMITPKGFDMKSKDMSWFEAPSQIFKKELSDSQIHKEKEDSIPKSSERHSTKSSNAELEKENAKCSTSIQVAHIDFVPIQQNTMEINSPFLKKGSNSLISERNELTKLISLQPNQATKLNLTAKNNKQPNTKTILTPKFHNFWTMEATVQEENCVTLKIQDLKKKHSNKQVKSSYPSKNKAKNPNLKKNVSNEAGTPVKLTKNASTTKLPEDGRSNFKPFEIMVKEPVGYKALFNSYKTDCEISDEYLELRETYLRQTRAESFVGNCECFKSYQIYDPQLQ